MPSTASIPTQCTTRISEPSVKRRKLGFLAGCCNITDKSKETIKEIQMTKSPVQIAVTAIYRKLFPCALISNEANRFALITPVATAHAGQRANLRTKRCGLACCLPIVRVSFCAVGLRLRHLELPMLNPACLHEACLLVHASPHHPNVFKGRRVSH